MALRTAARMTAFRPGQSPPPVRMPTFMPIPRTEDGMGTGNAKRPRSRESARYKVSNRALTQRVFYFLQPIRTLQDLPRFRTVRRPHDAVPLHQVDQVCRPAIANTQAPL